MSTKFQVQPASTSSKNYYLGNSSHHQKGSVNQVNFLAPKEPVIIYVGGVGGGGVGGGIFFVLASKKKRDQPFKPIS